VVSTPCSRHVGIVLLLYRSNGILRSGVLSRRVCGRTTGAVYFVLYGIVIRLFGVCVCFIVQVCVQELE
jgi:hypothetical protein